MSGLKNAAAHAALAAGSLVVTLLAFELTLQAMGVETLASVVGSVRPGNYEPMEASPCTAGSTEEFLRRLVPRRNAAFGWFRDPDLGVLPDLKPHGFNDPKNFYADHGARKRVLVLGDSFTFGLSAAPGHGWVDLLNAESGEDGPLFFNTGISGTGQMDQYAVLKKYHDVVRPDAVLLLFCPDNDFFDNVKAWDRSRLSEGGGPSAEEEARMLAQMKNNIQCPDRPDPLLHRRAWLQAHLREIFWPSRTGTLIWSGLRAVKYRMQARPAGEREPSRPEPGNRAYQRTKEELSRIQRYLTERGTPFYAMAVPDIAESKRTLTRSHNYRTAMDIFRELGISSIDLFPEFDLRDYKTRWPLVFDMHWNDRGHRKTAKIVRDRIEDGTWIGEALR